MIHPEFSKFYDIEISNSHLHFESLPLLQASYEALREMGHVKFGIVSCTNINSVNKNPEAMCFKQTYPGRTFIFGGLDYSNVLKDPSIANKDLERQVLALAEMGFDGIKIIETKPSRAKHMPFQIDDPEYENFFACLEENQMPMVWHVADPIDLWNEKVAPPVAREKGWLYSDGTYPTQEELFQRAERVMHKFRRLNIILPHFYFMSSELDRLSELFEEYPNVNIDLGPGTEMFIHLSKHVEKSREFFIRYQDRILFGDDDEFSGDTVSIHHVLNKNVFMRRFLETNESMVLPEGDENFLQRHGEVHGLNLPEDVLRKIYSENFNRIIGVQPAKLNVPLCIEECRRIGTVLRDQFNFDDKENFGFHCEAYLKGQRYISFTYTFFFMCIFN